MKSKLIFPLRVLFFILFFVSAFSKIYPNPNIAIHLFEKEQLISLGFPFCLSTWFSRLLIALEFVLAFGFLVPFFFKRITLPFSIGLMLFFTLFLSYEVFIQGKWSGNCGCFGQLIPMTPPVSLLKNGIALVLLAFLLVNRKYIKDRKDPHLFFAVGALLAAFSVIYFISPKTCVGGKEEPKPIKLSKEALLVKKNFPEIAKGKAVLCFYSPTCSHCQNTAKELASLQKSIGIETYYIVFMIESKMDEKVKEFLDISKIKCQHTAIEFIDFPEETDPPAVLILKDGEVKARFIGKDEKAFKKEKFLKAFKALD